VVSFGQGCEGEPLLEADALVEAVRELDRSSPRGSINLNSNASIPEAVARLVDAGLDSMRASMNSPRREVYAAYYNPRHYGFDEVERSVVEMTSRGRYASTNFLYYPGVSDTDEEIEAFGDFLARTGVHVVQVRNLNVDPEIYERALPPGTVRQGVGVAEFQRRISQRVPGIAYGYFNPTKAAYAEIARLRAAVASR
jgi:pyruvate-formate lyase-activating enzyme